VQWGQAFTYDGFGNMIAKTATKGTAPTFNTTIDPTTNGGPTSYDPHQIPDGSTDVEGRPLGSSTVRYFYDQAGKRLVTRTDIYGFGSYPYAATYEVAMYGLGGQRIATAGCSYDANQRPNCGVGGNNNVYFAGKMVMSRGVIVATDRLGSVRANGNGESFAYYPYGEERTSTSDGREKFGTYVRDNPGQDYADQRYYGVGSGRFGTPDPYQASAGAGSPKSWNHYLYVGGDPINFNDPTGQGECAVGQPVPCSTTVTGGMPIGVATTSNPFLAMPYAFLAGKIDDDDEQELPALEDNNNKSRASKFSNAIKKADSLLKKGDCAGLFGDGDVGKNTLESTTFTLAAVLQNNGNPDTNSVAVTPTVNGKPTGTVKINILAVNSFFGSSQVEGLGDNDWRAFVLLHELGHLTDKLGVDNGNQEDPDNPAYWFNRDILRSCFGQKIPY
jgi:RHS repeat-associated protein